MYLEIQDLGWRNTKKNNNNKKKKKKKKNTTKKHHQPGYDMINIYVSFLEYVQKSKLFFPVWLRMLADLNP